MINTELFITGMIICVIAVCTGMIPGGEGAKMKEAPGGRLAERTLTAKIDVTVKSGARNAVTETAETTVNTEAHPEVMKKEVSRTPIRCDVTVTYRCIIVTVTE